MANFPTGVPPIEVVRAYWKLSWPACCNLKGQLPPKTLICLLHSLAALVSSQPTSCFAHEQPFSVANAGQPTSFSIGALYTSIGGTPCKNFPLSVVRLYFVILNLDPRIRVPIFSSLSLVPIVCRHLSLWLRGYLLRMNKPRIFIGN